MAQDGLLVAHDAPVIASDEQTVRLALRACGYRDAYPRRTLG